MRIALLALHFAEYASRLAIALAARHQVLLVLRTDNAQRELTDELRGALARSVQVHCIAVRRFRDPRVWLTGRRVNRIIRAFAPDVLHVQEIHPLLNGPTVLSLRNEMPVVMTVHDPVGHDGRPMWNPLPWRVLALLRRASTRLIVHGPRMRGELQALDLRWADSVDAIPHGVLGEPGRIADSQGAEPQTFLFFGRMAAYKGLGYLLDAAEILRDRGHAVRLILAGAGEDLERHRTRIAAHCWIELIDRYVPPAEVAGLFRRAMAVVLPYTGATQSGVAAMALTNWRPVVATEVGDLPDMVIAGRTGLLVPPRDAVALADAMEKLLVDDRLRDALAAGAGRYAAATLSWPRVAELTAATYTHALEARQARARRNFAAGSAAAPDQPISR